MPTPVSALLHAATLVTAGIYLLIRSQAFFIIQPNLLITMTFIGSLTAFFAASTGLTQNDIKKIIAYSTCSQLGYLFLACGLGQFSISFFHLINHAFFVRQHRYLNLIAFFIYRLLKIATNSYTHTTQMWKEQVWELYDGPSLRNLLKRNKSTYLFFKFKYNLKWERLMKMNSRQNCIIMIGIFYSFEKFIPEIINEGPHITSRCRIEKISSPFLESCSLPLKIIQILKVGKQNLFNWFNKYFNPEFYYGVIINNFNSFNNVYILAAGPQGWPEGPLINYKYNSVLNVGPCDIKLYSMTPSFNNIERPFLARKGGPKGHYHNKKKDFRSECKTIFKLHKSHDKIISELNILIYKWIFLLGKSYKSLSFMKNYIHKRSWLWAKKKHKKVGKNILFNFYFKDNKFKVLPTIACDGAQTVESFGALGAGRGPRRGPKARQN